MKKTLGSVGWWGGEVFLPIYKIYNTHYQMWVQIGLIENNDMWLFILDLEIT
jgi:hypothetical protein